MVSLGGIIYLFARALPRVTDAPVPVNRKDYLAELMKKLPLEKADAWFAQLFGKFLRKAKIVILKFDNILTRHINSLKKDSGNAFTADRPNLFEKKEEGSDTSEIK